MDRLTSNMTISECLKHFMEGSENDLYMNVVRAEDNAVWLYCLNPCIVDGIELHENDLLLYERDSGKLCGVYKPIESTSNNKPTNTDATLGA